MLEFIIEDFQPAGALSIYKEKPDSEEETKMPLERGTTCEGTSNMKWLNMIMAMMKMNLIIHFLSLIGQAKQEEDI